MLNDQIWNWIASDFHLGEALTAADKINLLIALVTALGALGTIGAVVFAAFSARHAARAVREAATQMELLREQFRTQAFTYILSYERDIEFSKKMDMIRHLDDKSYGDLTPAEKHDIRVTADFLNHVAHLTRNYYVIPRHIFRLYWFSLDACYQKLIMKMDWLTHFRKEQNSPGLYRQFETLCDPTRRRRIWRGDPDPRVWPDDPEPILASLRGVGGKLLPAEKKQSVDQPQKQHWRRSIGSRARRLC